MWGRGRKIDKRHTKLGEKYTKISKKTMQMRQKATSLIAKIYPMDYNWIIGKGKKNVEITGGVGMYSARDVAAYVINWCNNNNIDITNLKLQKLLYFLQGEMYKYTGNRLIDDDFYAWQLGPVVPSVYSTYSMYSSLPLPNQVITVCFPRDCEEKIIGILCKYAPRSTWELVDLSHEQEPWKYNYQIFGDKSLIPYKSIQDYFKEA